MSYTPSVPSESQRRVLDNVLHGRDPRHHLTGRSEYGGFTGTWAVIQRNGWVASGKDGLSLTPAGRMALLRTLSADALRERVIRLEVLHEQACDRLVDLLLADDGQATKEAQKHLERHAPAHAARLANPPVPATGDSALAIPEDCPHLIVYDDQDRKQEVFAGSGARAAAHTRFKQISWQWNANLFALVAVNSRDSRHPPAKVVPVAGAAQASLEDNALREAWRAAGGDFHGPVVETGAMPEAQLLPFMRSLLVHGLPATPAATHAAQPGQPAPGRGYIERTEWAQSLPAGAVLGL